MFRLWGGGDRVHEASAVEWEVVFKEHADRVQVRGFYSCPGLPARRRPDDVVGLATPPTPSRTCSSRIRRSELGSRLELTHAFLGAVRPAEFNPDHLPAFLRGEDPKKYLCVYPFVRTPEWYLLPSEERARLLREHGEIGREFPDVLPNTTSAFGLGRLGVDPGVRGR